MNIFSRLNNIWKLGELNVRASEQIATIFPETVTSTPPKSQMAQIIHMKSKNEIDEIDEILKNDND